jgi:hypothetical protein
MWLHKELLFLTASSVTNRIAPRLHFLKPFEARKGKQNNATRTSAD